ncbi:MAG: arginase [Firmicutes bacterium]|nr:arginase [Bacillota bacterium]
MKKAVINACCSLGVDVDGTELASELITSHIKNDIYSIKSINIKENKSKLKNLKALNDFNSKLYSQVLDVLDKDMLPITVGGDHSIAIATALASIKKYNNLGIIWFDSHGDFNDSLTTITGNIHGLPLAVITGFENKHLADFHNGKKYNYKNTVIVGARDLDELEKENLKKCNITVFTTEDIKKYGALAICQKAFQIASNNTLGVHVSYDIDLIDPELAPGVSVPAKNGISKEDAYQIVDDIIKHKNIIKSLDIVEFNPLKDKDNITLNITKEIFNKIYNNL